MHMKLSSMEWHDWSGGSRLCLCRVLGGPL